MWSRRPEISPHTHTLEGHCEHGCPPNHVGLEGKREALCADVANEAGLHHDELYDIMTRLISGLKKGKTGAEEGVVPEFLQARSPAQQCDVIDQLHLLLRGKVPIPSSWTTAKVSLIPNSAAAVQAT